MNVHIGQEIEKKFQESGLKITAFADKINTGERNVYTIFRRKDISASLLKAISEALDFNFFKLFEEQKWSEPETPYLLEKRYITVTLQVKGEQDKFVRFSDMLEEIRNVARSKGFDLA